MEQFFGSRRESGDRLRWVPEQHWHLTTLFCGDVATYDVEPLVEALGEVASRQAAFDVRLTGAGVFPDVTAVRHLYLAVANGEGALAHLARGCRTAASRVGAEPDGTRFVPHLTLARARTRFDATHWLRVIDAFPGIGFPATALTVVESFINEGRGNRVRHEVLATLPLGTSGTTRAAPSSV